MVATATSRPAGENLRADAGHRLVPSRRRGLPALHNRNTSTGQQLYGRRHLESLEVTDEVFESPAAVVSDQA
jgi:hypothetical protein